MEKVSAVIVAAGRGARMGAGVNKVFLPLAGKEILLRSAAAFCKNPDIDEIVIVAGEGEHRRVADMLARAGMDAKLRAVTTGGATRRESVYNGIGFAAGDIIVVHDAARCLVSQAEISAAVSAARVYGAAAVGVPCKDTLKAVGEDGFITGTVDRERTFAIQTPQAFRRDVITRAHEYAARMNIDATDDCALVELTGGRIRLVAGRYDNIKITTPDDIAVAEKILEKRSDK